MLPFYLIVVVFVVLAIASSVRSLVSNKSTNSTQRKSFNFNTKKLFHETVGEMDEDHKDLIGNKLIEHPKAEPGYIILNGVKRKLEDCKYL